MKVLILYYSKGGNTRKLAEAIAEGAGQVDGVEAVLRHTREVEKDDFTSADGLILGSPVYFGTMAAQLKKVLDDFIGVRKKMEDKVGAAFATAGDASGGKETLEDLMIQFDQSFYICVGWDGNEEDVDMTFMLSIDVDVVFVPL